jgi:hypothetical protein
MNLHVPIDTVNFLTNPTTVSFSSGTLLHGVGWTLFLYVNTTLPQGMPNYAGEELNARKP